MGTSNLFGDSTNSVIPFRTGIVGNTVNDQLPSPGNSGIRQLAMVHDDIWTLYLYKRFKFFNGIRQKIVLELIALV